MSNRRTGGAARAAYDGMTRLLSLAMIVLGVLLVVRGGVIAVVLGVGMVAAGAGRLWILARLRKLR